MTKYLSSFFASFSEANLYRHYRKKRPSLLDARHFVGGRLMSLEHCRTLGTLRSADSAPADRLVATVSAAVFSAFTKSLLCCASLLKSAQTSAGGQRSI
jgi:hypothetical protein